VAVQLRCTALQMQALGSQLLQQKGVNHEPIRGELLARETQDVGDHGHVR
jgi:hypothetical protein